MNHLDQSCSLAGIDVEGPATPIVEQALSVHKTNLCTRHTALLKPEGVRSARWKSRAGQRGTRNLELNGTIFVSYWVNCKEQFLN